MSGKNQRNFEKIAFVVTLRGARLSVQLLSDHTGLFSWPYTPENHCKIVFTAV